MAIYHNALRRFFIADRCDQFTFRQLKRCELSWDHFSKLCDVNYYFNITFHQMKTGTKVNSGCLYISELHLECNICRNSTCINSWIDVMNTSCFCVYFFNVCCKAKLQYIWRLKMILQPARSRVW